MIISLSKKFIFIHNPKAAGTSIHQALSLWDDGKRYKSQPDRGEIKHETFPELIFRTSLNTTNFFVFGFVRNPWDRFSSLFHFLKKHNDRFPQINNINNINELAQNIDTPWLSDRYSIRPQHEYFDDNVFIGRYENLTNDFKYITDQIGIDIKLFHANQSMAHSYQELYNEEGRNIIANRYKKDIEIFGYKF